MDKRQNLSESTILDKICVDFLKCRDFQPPSPQNQCWAGLFAFRMNTGCNIETGGGGKLLFLEKR